MGRGCWGVRARLLRWKVERRLRRRKKKNNNRGKNGRGGLCAKRAKKDFPAKWTTKGMDAANRRRRTFRGVVEYDGSELGGWLVQNHSPENVNSSSMARAAQFSVQRLLEDAISHFTKERVRVVGSGKTDVGVHARGQVFHFSVDNERVDALGIERMLRGRFTRRAFNGVRQQSVLVRNVEEVSRDFHARLNVRAKTYSYLICEGTAPPHRARFAWSLLKARGALDVDAMSRVAGRLVGATRDYSRFAVMQEGDDRSTARTLLRCDVGVEERTRGRSIRARHDFVRLLFVQDGAPLRRHARPSGHRAAFRASVDDLFSSALRAKASAVVRAPAHGLVLEAVAY